MSDEGWKTLRVALVCAVVIFVIYGNAKTIDMDEFVKSFEIIALIITIAFGGKAKNFLGGLFGGKVKATRIDDRDDDDPDELSDRS